MNTYTFTLEVEKNGMRIQDYANYSNFIATLENLKKIRNKNVYNLDLPKGQKSSWIPFCLCREWGSPLRIEKAIEKYKEISSNEKVKNFFIENIQHIRNWHPNGKEDVYTIISYTANEPMNDILEEIFKVFDVEAKFS